MVSRCRGFSLIEIMVVLLIVGLLALATGPFTAAWVQSAQVHESRGKLINAHAFAKAAALRNRGMVTGADPAGALRLDADTNTVMAVSCPNNRGSCAETLLWSAELPAGVTVTFEPAAGADGIELTNRGLPVSGDPISFRIEKGGQHEDGALY